MNYIYCYELVSILLLCNIGMADYSILYKRTLRKTAGVYLKSSSLLTSQHIKSSLKLVSELKVITVFMGLQCDC